MKLLLIELKIFDKYQMWTWLIIEYLVAYAPKAIIIVAY